MLNLAIQQVRTIIFMAFMLSLLSACVVSETGGFKETKNDKAAIANRVRAAMQNLQKRDFEAAKSNLKKASAIDSSSPLVNDALGLTFQSSGEHELAEKYFKIAVKNSKGESRYRMNYAQYLYSRGEYIQAQDQLKTVVDDALYERRERALLLLGFCQQHMAMLPEAMRSFHRVLTLNRSNREALKQLGFMYFNSKEYDKSWQYQQAYRAASPRLNAEMLLLGINTAQNVGDEDAYASFVLALKNLYPNSKEYQSFLRSKVKR